MCIISQIKAVQANSVLAFLNSGVLDLATWAFWVQCHTCINCVQFHTILSRIVWNLTVWFLCIFYLVLLYISLHTHNFCFHFHVPKDLNDKLYRNHHYFTHLCVQIMQQQKFDMVLNRNDKFCSSFFQKNNDIYRTLWVVTKLEGRSYSFNFTTKALLFNTFLLNILHFAKQDAVSQKTPQELGFSLAWVPMFPHSIKYASGWIHFFTCTDMHIRNEEGNGYDGAGEGVDELMQMLITDNFYGIIHSWSLSSRSNSTVWSHGKSQG